MMMTKVKRFIVDCLRPLWMAFFLRRPTIEREVEQLDRQQQLKLIAQSLLIPFALTIIVGLVLESFGAPFNFTKGLTWIAIGIVGGIAGGIAVGIAGGIAVGIAFGIVFSIAFSIAFGIVVGIAIGIAFGIVGGIAIGIAGGIVGDIAGGGAAFSITFGIPIGIGLGITVGIAGNIELGIALGSAIIAGVLRIPFLLLGLLTTLWSLASVRQNPHQALRFLHRSLAYWDELTQLPQPFLARLIVAVGEHDQEAARKAITHLSTNTFQRRAAETALLELGSRELPGFRTVEEIGQFAPASFWASSFANEKREQSAAEAFARFQKISADIRTGVSATSNYNKLNAFDRARRQLEELRQFAVIVLRGKESQTFARIAQQWLDAVNAEIDRLTKEERAAENIPNPYIAPNPLVAGNETFVGRESSFRSVEEHFLRSAESAPMLLTGQPRIGKTSLLCNLDKRLPTNLIPVYVDMQRSGLVESTEQLLANLAKAVSQGLASHGIRVSQPAAKDFAAEPFSVFDDFLDVVEQAARPSERREAHRIILALDEFEVIEQKLTEGKVSKDLMPYLRSMMQHRREISLLFAGTHTLDEMIGELWIPYFRSAVPHRVSYLDEASARKLITNPIANFPLNYDPEAVDRMIAETRCHPCLIQLTCSALVDLKNQQKSHQATIADVEHALNEVLKLSGRYVFEGIWEWIPKEERNLLMFAAASEAMTIPQAARALTMPESRVSGIVERLIEAEVLTRASSRAEFQFEVPLFRRWVVRHAARAGMDWGELRRVAG